jgi:hypothetical protein
MHSPQFVKLFPGRSLVPNSMHETMNGWIHRNVDCFGQPKQSGDDCHETVDAQLSYLSDAEVASADVLWQQEVWSVFRWRRHDHD